MLTIDRTNLENLDNTIGFNYEFDCFKDSQTDWPTVETELSNVNNLSDYFSDMIDKLLEAM